MSPVFSIEILDPSGNFVLKSDHLAKCQTQPQPAFSRNKFYAISTFQQMRTMLQDNVEVVENIWDEEDEETDELEEDYAL